MSNPYWNQSEVFGDPSRPQSGGAQTATQPRFGQMAPPGYVAPTQAAPAAQSTIPGATAGDPYGLNASHIGLAATDTASQQAQWAAAHGGYVEVKRLTYDAVILRTGGLLALLIVVAGVTWQLAPQIWPVGMIVGLVFGLINAFKREPSPILIVLYTLAQGVFLGGVSYAFTEMTFDGQSASPIVFQAVLATLATFGVALALFRSGRVRVTPKFTRFLMVALGGFLIFQLVNLLLVWTRVLPGWGARGGGMGLAVGAFAIFLATMCLIQDFDSIKRGVENGAPVKFAWSAAFGLMVT
ncbi:MAG: Bax inhibitor-1/YccA family protein, partial [Promicromonosporaceae bacterium]|nr:Bax inhibitor-1/YccA family protein [Promicromonosporaceae bacterium]